MALHTKKLYYVKGGTTYSINLYTSTSDIGPDYISIRDGSTTVYAPLGEVTAGDVSFIRVMKGGTVKGILTAYNSCTTSYVVPAGVTSLSVKMWGAGGGDLSAYYPGNYGGAGGCVTGVIPVTPLETLTLVTGVGAGNGFIRACGNAGYGAYFTNQGAQGGGASWIFRGSTPLMVAGGGGGAPQGNGSGKGGGGGGLTAQAGATGTNPARHGQGGTQSAGGAGGAGNPGAYNGLPGSYLQGGDGVLVSNVGGLGGSGGGGGYYGGGGGGSDTAYLSGGAGGGGSSYTDSSVTSVVHYPANYNVPGNSSDPDRGVAGNPVIMQTEWTPGVGKIVITY